MTIEIIVVGENAQDPYQDGHGVRVFVESEHTCPTTQKHFQSKDMTRDFACSPTIRSAGGPSSEDGVTAQVSETTCHKSIRTGFYLSFGTKLLCKAHPKTPHRGFISSALVLISTLGILGILSIMACHQIYLHSSSSEGGGKSESSLQGIPGISEGNASIIGTSKGGTLGVSKGAKTFGFTTSFADVDTEKIEHSNSF
jgi:hypothetical protein